MEDGKTNTLQVISIRTSTISNHKVILIAESKGGRKIDGHLVTMNILIRNSQRNSVSVEHMRWWEGWGRRLDVHQFNGGRMEDT